MKLVVIANVVWYFSAIGSEGRSCLIYLFLMETQRNKSCRMKISIKSSKCCAILDSSHLNGFKTTAALTFHDASLTLLCTTAPVMSYKFHIPYISSHILKQIALNTVSFCLCNKLVCCQQVCRIHCICSMQAGPTHIECDNWILIRYEQP